MDWLVALLLVVAGGFGLVGSLGLVRLPDTMTRLHAPTKAATLGVGGVLVASMLWHGSWHELLITLFLFVTAPVTASFIAKAEMARRGRVEVPPPPAGDWATFADRPEG